MNAVFQMRIYNLNSDTINTFKQDYYTNFANLLLCRQDEFHLMPRLNIGNTMKLGVFKASKQLKVESMLLGNLFLYKCNLNLLLLSELGGYIKNLSIQSCNISHLLNLKFLQNYFQLKTFNLKDILVVDGFMIALMQ